MGSRRCPGGVIKRRCNLAADISWQKLLAGRHKHAPVGIGRCPRRNSGRQPKSSDQINEPTPANSGPPGCLDIYSIGLGKRRLEFEAPPPAKHTDFHGRNRELFQFKVVEKWPNPVESRAFRVDLSALQTLTIRRLQSKLVREPLEHHYLPEAEQDPAWLRPDADYQSSTMRQYGMVWADNDDDLNVH